MDAKGVEAFIMRCSCIRVYERVYTRGPVCVALKTREIKRPGLERDYGGEGKGRRAKTGGAAARRTRSLRLFTVVSGCLRSVRNWENQESPGSRAIERERESKREAGWGVAELQRENCENVAAQLAKGGDRYHEGRKSKSARLESANILLNSWEEVKRKMRLFPPFLVFFVLNGNSASIDVRY